MLGIKSTHLFSDIASFFEENDSSSASITMMRMLKSFYLPPEVTGLEDHPNSKYKHLQILLLLILFPCFGIRNVHRYGKSSLYGLEHMKKDVFYRFLKNGGISWRKVMYCFSRQMLHKIESRSDSRKSKDPVCLIVDDTDFKKAGKSAELLGFVYSHALQQLVLGFKGLFLLRTDGKTQTVLDYSLHGERGKNADRPYGMTRKERKRQYFKTRTDKERCVQERISEYDTSKISNTLKMVGRATLGKIKYDYLLADSWFACTEIIRYFKNPNRPSNYLGMAKMGNTRYEYEGCRLTLKEIIRRRTFRGGRRWSGATSLYHTECAVKLDGMEIRVFFFRKSKRSKWVPLITTDMKINYLQALKIYSMRWSIEVFFKEAKGLLGLGKAQMRDFASQIAMTAIVALQYNILSLAKRFTDYETIGGLFEDITKDTVKLSVTDRIWNTIIKVVSKIAIWFDLEYKTVMDKLMETSVGIGRNPYTSPT